MSTQIRDTEQTGNNLQLQPGETVNDPAKDSVMNRRYAKANSIREATLIVAIIFNVILVFLWAGIVLPLLHPLVHVALAAAAFFALFYLCQLDFHGGPHE